VNILAAIFMLALTRAEIIERMRAPVVTRADGLVKVYASCPEDVRREFQSPVARFAADTVSLMYRSQSIRPRRFSGGEIVIHLGDTRTNDTRVIARVRRGAGRPVSRIYLENPATADIGAFRREIIKAFFRSVLDKEIDDAAADRAARDADPSTRIKDARERLENWLAGKGGVDAEEGLKLMRKVLEPGRASRRDVLVFASRLFIYPETFDQRFCGRFKVLSFRDALRFAKADPRIRLAAYRKSGEMVLFAGGRGEKLAEAGELYCKFLQSLTRLDGDAARLLDEAEEKLNVALEEARRREEGEK
jgi:hypothetical protein